MLTTVFSSVETGTLTAVYCDDVASVKFHQQLNVGFVIRLKGLASDGSTEYEELRDIRCKHV